MQDDGPPHEHQNGSAEEEDRADRIPPLRHRTFSAALMLLCSVLQASMIAFEAENRLRHM